MTAAYVVATDVAPSVVCPSWCQLTEQEHVDGLAAWDGYAVHSSPWLPLPFFAKGKYQLGVSSFVDGRQEYPVEIGVSLQDGLHLDDLRNVADALSEIAETARTEGLT